MAQNSKSNIQTMSTQLIHNMLKKYKRLQGHVSTPVEFVEQLEAELLKRQQQKSDLS